MPYMICPACRLTSYSAAGLATHDRCPRCDAPLDADRAEDSVRRWNLEALRATARREELEHGLAELEESVRERVDESSARAGGGQGDSGRAPLDEEQRVARSLYPLRDRRDRVEVKHRVRSSDAGGR
jgi:hypothetical protein